jgi:hypothetical protein
MAVAPRAIISIIASVALVTSSTAVAVVAAPANSQQPASPWAILTLTSGGSPAAVVCGTAAAAATAQSSAGCVLPTLDTAPVPVSSASAPPASAYVMPAAGGITGEVLPFLLMFGLIAIALTTSGPSGASSLNTTTPNSPT